MVKQNIKKKNLKPASGIVIGLNKGFITTKREEALRPSHRKGIKNKRVQVVKSVIHEVAGYSPYEKRIMELLKGGGTNANKKAYKFAKKRLGTHSRGKRKVAAMATIISSSKI